MWVPKWYKPGKKICIFLKKLGYFLTYSIFSVYCIKSAQSRSFFWPVFSCIQSEYRKIRTRKSFVFGQFSRRGMFKKHFIYSVYFYVKAKISDFDICISVPFSKVFKHGKMMLVMQYFSCLYNLETFREFEFTFIAETPVWQTFWSQALHLLNKNLNFPLKISSVNVTKSDQETADLVTFTKEFLNEKLGFLCSDWQMKHWSFSVWVILI